MKTRSPQDPEVLQGVQRVCLWKMLMKGQMSCLRGWQFLTRHFRCLLFLLHGVDKGLANSCLLIIKQCAAFANRSNIEIFLQCHEPGAFRFYCMLGFQRLNSNHEDGFTLLPKNLQDVLFAVPPKKKKGGHRQSTFSFWGDDPEQVGQSVTKLMHLGHEQLQAVTEIDEDSPLVSSATTERLVLDNDVHIPLTEMWCEYPPPCFGPGGNQLSYSISLIEKLLKGLPLIQELLPPTYANPVPATSLPVKGHISNFAKDHT